MNTNADLELDKLARIILFVVLLVILVAMIVVLKGKGGGLLDKIKDLIYLH